jgi:hypothetical protein
LIHKKLLVVQFQWKNEFLIFKLLQTMNSNFSEIKNRLDLLEENNKALNLRIDNILLNIKQGLTSTNPEIKSSQTNNIPQQTSVAAPSVTTQDKVNSSSGVGQCAATTKKGTRCSRSASSNGYCWQHGGN